MVSVGNRLMLLFCVLYELRVQATGLSKYRLIFMSLPLYCIIATIVIVYLIKT